MEKRLSPIKAIRQHCIGCSGGSKKEVKLCTIKDCHLYPYRLGTNPNRKSRMLTDDEKKEKVEILRKARMLKDNKNNSLEQ